MTDLPPCDKRAEEFILSESILVGPPEGLEPHHFFYDAHRWIFEALVVPESHPLERPLCKVVRRLRRSGSLAAVGGSSAIVRLLELPSESDEHVRIQAEAIVEYWRRRVVADAALQIAAELRCDDLFAAQAWRRFKVECERATA